jgi:hypothetical protein
MTAVPTEILEAVENLPAVSGEGMAFVWAHGMASCGLDVCTSLRDGRHDSAQDAAVRLAAASIRLVEYLNQNGP